MSKCLFASVCVTFLLIDTATPVLYTYLPPLSLHDALPISFGRSCLGDLDASGRKDLEQLAERVAQQEAQVQNVTIYGFADRIGSAGGNYDLSLARAHTVADLLAAKGVDSKLIEVVAKRSEEHTSELQSLMRISYAVFCLKKKK